MLGFEQQRFPPFSHRGSRYGLYNLTLWRRTKKVQKNPGYHVSYNVTLLFEVKWAERLMLYLLNTPRSRPLRLTEREVSAWSTGCLAREPVPDLTRGEVKVVEVGERRVRPLTQVGCGNTQLVFQIRHGRIVSNVVHQLSPI